MKLFDYKFIVLIGLTLTVYFLYKELNSIKNRVKYIENKNDVLLKTLENREVATESNNVIAHENIQIPNFNELSQISNVMQNLTREQIDINLGGNEIVVKSQLSPISENENIILPNDSCSLTEIEESELQETTIENDMNEEDAVEIYSNDNVNEINTSISSSESNIYEQNNIELLEKKLSEDDIEKFQPSTLLKNNKLAELQDLAESLKIDLKIEGKKKTKLQLANEIFNSKSNTTNS